ncbi:MAG: hypothetical protein ACREBJ_11445 [Nitrosotalea sp.]
MSADIRIGTFTIAEGATGTVNGINTVFSSSNKYISGTIRVYLNGQRLIKDTDFTETTDQSFTLIDAPLNTLGYTDKIEIEYEQK